MPDDHLTQAEKDLAQRNLARAAEHFHLAQADPLLSNRVDGGLWQMHMLAGDFEQAWQASDRLRASDATDPHRFWTGESLAGKQVIVRSLHGFGDAVQMFGYAPRLQALAASVTWQVPPRLLELATRFHGVTRVITWEEPCLWDVQVEITELPYLFRTTLWHLPLATRYLHLPAQPPAPGKPRIGIVWTAGDWNPTRSVPFPALDPILDLKSFSFVSLQSDSHPEPDPRLQSIGPGLLTLATAIAGLDCIVTVDTLAAHLGGALGIPTFVLLEFAADWRWMTGRDDSPWYPSLRLFRQPRPGDWATPIHAIRQALDTLTP